MQEHPEEEALDGGSINIFYNTINQRGIFNTTGGLGGTKNWYGGSLIATGGNGGNGTVSCGSILAGTYREYEENVE